MISTAAQSSSGGGYYYYGGASTPGISAVKTADAAKSATDYTSGIYGPVSYTHLDVYKRQARC